MGWEHIEVRDPIGAVAQGGLVPAIGHLVAGSRATTAFFGELVEKADSGYGVSSYTHRSLPVADFVSLRRRLFIWPFRWTTHFTWPQGTLTVGQVCRKNGHRVLQGHRTTFFTRREWVHRIVGRLSSGQGSHSVTLHHLDPFEETITRYTASLGTAPEFQTLMRRFYNPWVVSGLVGGGLGIVSGLVRLAFGAEQTVREAITTVAASSVAGFLSAVTMTVLRKRYLIREARGPLPFLASLAISIAIETAIHEGSKYLVTIK